MVDGGKKIVHVAVAVVWREGRLLIARRPHHTHQGGMLEFPGGKVEPGENVRQALVRELLEETAVTVSPEDLESLIGIRHDYGDKEVFLDVWQARESSGEPHGVEGQPVFWLAPDELKARDFPAANRPIISAIRLPRQLAISGDAARPDEAVDRCVLGVGRQKPPLMVLRLPSLSSEAYTEVAGRCLKRLPETPLIVHDRPELVADLPVAGVHLSWRRAAELAGIGADYATLGPVLPTRSHPGVRGMGWERFSELASQAVLPVYALGGTSPELLDRAIETGGQGIAGISWWWPTQEAETT
jgi:8-oxo-dGTP diphosphatase